MVRCLRRLLYAFLLLFYGLQGYSQDSLVDRNDPYVDSLKQGLAHAHSAASKLDYLTLLITYAPDLATVQHYGNQAILEAQLSRDRRLIVSAYLAITRRWLNNSGLASNLDQASQYVTQAEQIAKDNGLDVLLVYSYCDESDIWRFRGDAAKAMAYANEAMGVAANLGNDSASESAYACMGRVYLERNEMLLSLRNYLEALDIAERSGDHSLLQDIYVRLDRYYSRLHSYDKCIDYEMKSYELCARYNPIGKVAALYRIGELFGITHQTDLALQFYERALRTADSVRFPLMKFDIYFRTFAMYFNANEYAKAMEYLRGHEDVLKVLDDLGFDFYVDELYGIGFFKQGRYDSALVRLRKAEPQVEKRALSDMKCEFYTNFGDYYHARGDINAAIAYYRKAYDVSTAVGMLSVQKDCADTLEQFYEHTGDVRNAFFFNKVAVRDQDSLRSEEHTSDLMRLEVDNDKRRRDRLAQEEELNMERRHNIQYMGFTAGLVLFFISVVLLGRLSVPPWVIRTVVFLSFIFLFEFIILLADKRIQAFTHEEPWKILLIKIVLAAGLVPLHHWLEHKVIRYLNQRRKPNVRGHGSPAAAKEQAHG